MVGEPGKGFYQTMKVFNTSRIGLAAVAYGTALGAYTMAYQRATTRNIFGRPIIEHQSKRDQFADNLARLEAGWLMVLKAAWLFDTGQEYRYHSSMAKLFCTEEAMKITQWAAETFGALGVLGTNQASRYVDDARSALIGEGAPEVQKKIVAEHIKEVLDSLS